MKVLALQADEVVEDNKEEEIPEPLSKERVAELIGRTTKVRIVKSMSLVTFHWKYVGFLKIYSIG